MLTVYGVFLIMWEILCAVLFMETFMPDSQQSVLHKGILIILWGIADILMVSFLSEHFMFKQICIVVLSALAVKIYFSGKYIHCLVLFILFQGCGILIDYITVLSLQNLFYMTMDVLSTPFISMLVSAISKLLLFCAVLFVRKRFSTKETELLTSEEWIRFSFFPLFSLFSIIAIIMNWELAENERQMNILLSISIGMLILDVIVFYMIQDVLKREKKIHDYSIFKERVKNETEMYRSISDNYDIQRKRIHEFKNHIACIVELSKKGEYSQLNHYLEKFDEKMKAEVDLIDTNHTIVNAILNSKYRECRDKGIVFVLQLGDLQNIHIEDEDIVIILSNLLNNAIEACEKVNERIIKFKMMKEGNQLIISIINKMSGKILMENEKILTTKEDALNHGIGIENIKNTLEKYHGIYKISTQNDIFKFVIIIPE